MSDLISRQAAIDAVNNERCEHGVIKDILCDKILISAKDRIRRLPPAQPERKTGKWLCSDDLYETAVCSCCGWDTTEPWQHIKSWFEFCPHCGADMRGEQK